MRLTLSLNHQCNLRCSYCYGGSKSDRPTGEDVLGKALDIAFAHPDDMVRVSAFGGEPLLEPGLLVTLAMEARKRASACGKSLRLTLTTNGTLLSGRRLDLLEEHGFDVTVSLDGDRQAHDSARRFPDGRGSFDAVVAGMESAREALDRVKTVSVVHPGNVDRLGSSFAFIAALDVTTMSFVPDYDARWQEADLERLEQAVDDLADGVIEEYREGRDLLVQPLHDKIVSRLKGGFASSDMCDFGCAEIAVAPSGRIYPCDRLIGEDGEAARDLVIGHVDTGVVMDRVMALKEPKDRPRRDCSGCAIVDRCMWWCGCVNRSLTGRVDGASDILCRIEKAWVRAADRVASTLYGERNPSFLQRYYIAASAAPA